MKRILVGLDGSSEQQRVFAAAVDLAERLGARLVLFHAVAIPLQLPVQALTIPPADVSGLVADSSRVHLEELARSAATGVVEKIVVEVGNAWRTLCEAARSEKADLVVIGSHGYGGLDRLVGTTASKVVDHAPCSVFVVRAPHA